MQLGLPNFVFAITKYINLNHGRYCHIRTITFLDHLVETSFDELFNKT